MIYLFVLDVAVSLWGSDLTAIFPKSSLILVLDLAVWLPFFSEVFLEEGLFVLDSQEVILSSDMDISYKF